MVKIKVEIEVEVEVIVTELGEQARNIEEEEHEEALARELEVEKVEQETKVEKLSQGTMKQEFEFEDSIKLVVQEGKIEEEGTQKAFKNKISRSRGLCKRLR